MSENFRAGGSTSSVFSRRLLFAQALGAASLWLAGSAHAFGQAGTFSARLLTTGGKGIVGPRRTAPARWEWELVRRTSAPARLLTVEVAADQSNIYKEPFLVWAGDKDVPALTASEMRGLAQFLQLGGVLVVDDVNPADGAFGRAARRELRRVIPDSPVVRLDAKHVIFKSYYIIDRPVGRVQGKDHVDAIMRGKNAQVILLSHDLLGALARTDEGGWAFPTDTIQQREIAVRLAVNLAMYVLCSDYKDDLVHAPWLMRRRAQSP